MCGRYLLLANGDNRLINLLWGSFSRRRRSGCCILIVGRLNKQAKFEGRTVLRWKYLKLGDSKLRWETKTDFCSSCDLCGRKMVCLAKPPSIGRDSILYRARVSGHLIKRGVVAGSTPLHLLPFSLSLSLSTPPPPPIYLTGLYFVFALDLFDLPVGCILPFLLTWSVTP